MLEVVGLLGFVCWPSCCRPGRPQRPAQAPSKALDGLRKALQKSACLFPPSCADQSLHPHRCRAPPTHPRLLCTPSLLPCAGRQAAVRPCAALRVRGQPQRQAVPEPARRAGGRCAPLCSRLPLRRLLAPLLGLLRPRHWAFRAARCPCLPLKLAGTTASHRCCLISLGHRRSIHPPPLPCLQRHMVDCNQCKMAYDGNEEEYEVRWRGLRCRSGCCSVRTHAPTCPGYSQHAWANLRIHLKLAAAPWGEAPVGAGARQRGARR